MDRALLDKAIKVLKIQDVFIGSHAVRVAEDFQPGNIAIATSSIFNWGALTGTVQEVADASSDKLIARLWRVDFQTRTRLLPTPPEGEVTQDNIPDDSKLIADLSARFVLIYVLDKDAEIDEKALTEFATHNVSYHAWPYWREWLQSTCARAGLPHIPLAMHMLKSARPDRNAAKMPESVDSQAGTD
jgi:hypothetical protein